MGGYAARYVADRVKRWKKRTARARWDKCAQDQASTYAIRRRKDDAMYIEFQPCGVTSYHEKDIENGYCAYCGRFITQVTPRRLTLAQQTVLDRTLRRSVRKLN